MSAEQSDIQNQFCVEVYCSIQPRLFAIDFDSRLVDRDPPRLRLRRVWQAVREAMYPLPDRLKRAIYGEKSLLSPDVKDLQHGDERRTP